MSALKEWYQLTEQLKAAADRFVRVTIPVIGRDLSRVHRVAYGLLARNASNFKGMVILARADRVVETRMLARACVENMFYLNKLLEDGDAFVKRMEEANI